MKHIAVIGAGITGVTTAYALARRGFQVTVIDRHRYAAMETSFANGGQLSASNAEVWNHPATLMKGARWLLKNDAPLLINPTPTWHKISWLLEFIAALPGYEKNTVATASLAIAAREHLFSWAESEGIDFDLKKRGILHVYRNRESFEHAGRVSQLLARGGLARRAVTETEIRAIEPTLSGSYYGGYYTESDSTGDIHKFTNGLAAAARRRGVAFRHDTEVKDVRSSRDGVWVTVSGAGGDEPLPFDGLVVCAGTASRVLARKLGDRVNVYPVKGYSITVKLNDAESQAAAPEVSLLDDDAKLVTSRLGVDRFRVAGTAELNGFSKDIRADRIKPLVDWVKTCFPGVCTREVIPWAGLRPMMPDLMPRVGAGKRAGVYYNTGHGHLGWTLSAATAVRIAERIAADAKAAAPQLVFTRSAVDAR